MDSRLRFVDKAFALLIGIDDYSAYDASTGKAKGTSDLAAGKNDVAACYRMCRALGIRPENIRVLTSPKLTPADLEAAVKPMTPGYVGEATNAEIQAQLAWLASSLEHAPGDADAPVGLLSYSGHGDFADGHLALCPTDVRVQTGAPAGADLAGVLGFPQLQAIVSRARGAAEALTVVLDCCHAGAASASATSRRPGRTSLTGRTRTAKGPVVQIGERMLMASAPGETAYQAKFDGQDHGALTWALRVVTDQYRILSEGDVDQFTIAHGDLRNRAQKLLDALSFPQSIQLVGPPGIDRLCFFHRGGDSPAEAAKAASAPDRARHPIQLDPTTLTSGYRLYTWLSGTAIVAQCLVAKDAKTYTGKNSYSAGVEYWFATSNSAPTAFTWSDSAWPTADPMNGTAALFTASQSVSWDNGEATPGAVLQLAGSNLYVAWPTALTGTGRPSWYATSNPANGFFGAAQSCASVTLAAGTYYSYLTSG